MQSFNQKYRPKTVADFYLPDNLRHTLNSCIVAGGGEIHLLLIGEPNTGKTALLQALVHDYYGGDAPIHDRHVLFVNNLEEQQGVNYFRNEMRSFCQTRTSLPPHLRKVIIIDDLDTIHQQCQQVLCNYIDTYGHQILFLFSASNQQKIIENVQSRTAIVRLPSPERANLETLYAHIVATEGIAEWFPPHEYDQIQQFLLDIADNQYRELINHFEKIIVYHGKQASSAEPTITMQICHSLFLMRIFQSFRLYMQHVMQGKLNEAIEVMNGVVRNGYSVVDIFDYFFKYIKGCEEVSETVKYEIIKLLCHYISLVRNLHEENIELILFTNRLIPLVGGSAPFRG